MQQWCRTLNCRRPTEDFRIEDRNRASLMPEIPMTEHDTWIRINDTDDAVGGTRAASDSFERAEGKYVERKDQRISELSLSRATDSQTL